MTLSIEVAGRIAALALAIQFAQVPSSIAQTPPRKLQPSLEACLKAPTRTCLLQEAVEDARALVLIMPELALVGLTDVGRTLLILKRDREASHLFAEAQQLASALARRSPGVNFLQVDPKVEEAKTLFALGRINEALALVTPATKGIADYAVSVLSIADRPDEAAAFLPGVPSHSIGTKRTEVAEAYARAGATGKAIATLDQIEPLWKSLAAGKMVAAAEDAGDASLAKAVLASGPENTREAIRRSAANNKLSAAFSNVSAGDKIPQ